MKLKPNTIITLENNKKYLLLNETNWNQKNYFLAMEVSQNKEVIPSNVAILEEIYDNSNTFVEKVNDSNLIVTLTQRLKAQL